MRAAIIQTRDINSEMNSAIPTCLHPICNKAMIEYVIDALKQASVNQIYLDCDDYSLFNKIIEKHALLKKPVENADQVIEVKANLPFINVKDVEAMFAGKDIKHDFGIYDRVDLAKAEKEMRKKINKKIMLSGVTIIDPRSTYIDGDVVIGKDSIIYPNVHLYHNTKIGCNCVILPNSFISNAIIGDNVTIDSSRITDSSVDAFTTIGPMSHIRNGCHIGQKVRIGNFVEFKNSNFGNNSKCAHLTYIGDSDVGEDVNIGCGVVTVNYDGKYKYRTTIKDGAFIGSNCNLIAPVEIGENVVLAAGSTITDNVEAGDMGIARCRQSVVKGYGYKYKDKNKKRKV